MCDVTRLLLLLVALIPGAGPILLGHGAVGALLMVLGLAGWNAVFVGAYLWQGPEAEWIAAAGWGVGPLCTLASWWWTVVATSPRRRARRKALAERALGIAQKCYLRDKLRGAEAAVRAGLAAAPDDIDLLFVAWVVSRRLGNQQQAQRRLTRLQRLDVDDKWTWEVHREGTLPQVERESSVLNSQGSQAIS